MLWCHQNLRTRRRTQFWRYRKSIEGPQHQLPRSALHHSNYRFSCTASHCPPVQSPASLVQVSTEPEYASNAGSTMPGFRSQGETRRHKSKPNVPPSTPANARAIQPKHKLPRGHSCATTACSLPAHLQPCRTSASRGSCRQVRQVNLTPSTLDGGLEAAGWSAPAGRRAASKPERLRGKFACIPSTTMATNEKRKSGARGFLPWLRLALRRLCERSRVAARQFLQLQYHRQAWDRRGGSC